MSSPPRAVLFDFDGVIADTENVHVVAWERAFARMGIEVAPEICARAAEQDDRLFLGEVLRTREIADGDIEGWVRVKQEITRGILEGSPRLFPGVTRLVHALQPHARLAIVTTTWLENVALVLDAAGLTSAFERVVGKELLVRPKPDPQAYLLALTAMKLQASEVVALEDSPEGIQAAQGAGIRVVAVGHRRPRGPWCGEAPYVPRLLDTPAVLAALGFPADLSGA
jgi:HAD superfamily hydrolase (TIGR01509 family)